MWRALIGGFLLISVVGCNRAEKLSLKQFLNSYETSLGHRYDDQLKGLPDSERNVRFRVLFGRDQLAAIDAYLATQPPLSATAQKEVNDFRATIAAELNLYEHLLTEKRYEATEMEKKHDADLRMQVRKNLEAIGRLADK